MDYTGFDKAAEARDQAIPRQEAGPSRTARMRRRARWSRATFPDSEKGALLQKPAL